MSAQRPGISVVNTQPSWVLAFSTKNGSSGSRSTALRARSHYGDCPLLRRSTGRLLYRPLTPIRADGLQLHHLHAHPPAASTYPVLPLYRPPHRTGLLHKWCELMIHLLYILPQTSKAVASARQNPRFTAALRSCRSVPFLSPTPRIATLYPTHPARPYSLASPPSVSTTTRSIVATSG